MQTSSKLEAAAVWGCGSPRVFDTLAAVIIIIMELLTGIIDLHFGTIAATSPGLGSGCTLTVELPVVRRIQPLICPPEQQQVETADPPSVTPMQSKDSFTIFGANIKRPDLAITPWKQLSKVLVVDDSAPSRKMLCR